MEPFLEELKERVVKQYGKEKSVIVYPVTEGKKDVAFIQINKTKQCRIFYFDVTNGFDKSALRQYTFAGTPLLYYRVCAADDYEIVVDKDNPEGRLLKNTFFNSFRSYCNWWYRDGISSILKQYEKNPKLIANLNDGGAIKSKYDLNYVPEDETRSIKEVFGVSIRYLRAAGLSYHKAAKWCWEHNFTPEQTMWLFKRLSDWDILNNVYSIRQLKYIAQCIKEDSITKSCFDVWIYHDYCNMRKFIIEEGLNVSSFPECPADHSSNNIHRLHDLIVPVHNRARALADKRNLQEKTNFYLENHYSNAKALEYSDEKFSIIACKDLSELGYEGSELHHCVGSYVDSVGHGREYILFLRKNEEIDKPFYTIDVYPNKTVRQIHGKCNCNMSKEITPFVKKWAKKFELNLKDCSGVYCALRWNQIARMAVDVSKLVRLIN